MKRIGYLTYGLDRSPTGIGRYAIELLRAMKGLPGCPEIVLLTTEQSDPHNLWDDFERHPLPGCGLLPALLAAGNAALSAAIKRYDLDLVHDPNGIAPFFGPAFGAKRVATIHDAFPYVYPQTHNRLDNWRYRWLLPQAARRADLVLTDSHHSASDIARYLHLPANQIKAIACAVNSSFTPVPDSPERRAALTRYKVEPPYLFYLGGITARKNIAGLLEAFARIQPGYPGLKLVIAGKRQWQTAEIDAAFARLGQSAPVHFTGYLAESDLPALYSAATAFVFPSLYEGFGLPPLEAMACGTPVVTSNLSSLPEVVGEAALTVNPHSVKELGAAIKRVLSEPDLRADLRQRGLERAALFSWERAAHETLEAYHHALETSSRPVRSFAGSFKNEESPPPVVLVGGASSSLTGLSRYGRNLSTALSQQGQPIIPGAIARPPLPGPFFNLARKMGFDLNTFFSTYPLALAARPEQGLLHLTSQNLASAVAFKKPARLVITVHDLITLACRQQPEITGYMRFYDRLFDNLAARGLKKADFLIADSEHTRQDIIQRLNYPPKCIKVIYLGVEHAQFKPATVSADFYNRYNLEKNKAYLIYAGSEDPRKNLRRLLAAFKLVTEACPQARLIKVGAARFQGERQALLAEIEKLGLAGKVHFFDQVSDEDLVYFYNLASVFVFPSLYEGFGLPPLEAMACGTPVVCSSAAALPEVVGEAALLVDPFDVPGLAAAIERVLCEPGLSAELRRRGLERAAGFTWERTAQQTLEVYRQVLENS
ncbi:MAG TPA: glycosyltransferase family 1 protein [Chloroflexia bacterium]|nr:glycosyltransferase family 1 protein [Chloroflexia bacterium]